MLYVFDVDMTLAPSDQMMKDDMYQVFSEFRKNRRYAFVSGSMLPKMQQQIPADIIEDAQALFPCIGCEFWKDGTRLYRHTFEWPEGLKEDLARFLEESTYPVKAGEHLVDRTATVYFSVLGKAATLAQREAYAAYDAAEKERKRMADFLNQKYPTISASIGGQVGIDISMKGKDKGQILPVLREHFGNGPIAFFGDRMNEDGNDYPLAQALKQESENNKAIHVQNIHDTMQHLQAITADEAAWWSEK